MDIKKKRGRKELITEESFIDGRLKLKPSQVKFRYQIVHALKKRDTPIICKYEKVGRYTYLVRV